MAASAADNVMRIARCARHHAGGIAVAAFLAGVMVYPRWWLLATSPADGARIHVSPWGAGNQGEDEGVYAAGVRTVFDGDLRVTDFFLKAGSDPLATMGPVRIVGLMAHLTGDIFSSLALVTTLFAFALFILLYALGLRLTGSRLLATLLVPTLFLAMHIHSMAGGLLPLRHGDVLERVLTIDPRGEFHAWSRYVAPAMPAPIALAALLALPAAVAPAASRGLLLLTAALLALLAYMYVFPTAILALALAMWLAWFAWRRDWPRARKLATIGALTTLLALPEIAIIVRSALEATSDYRARTGFSPFALEITWVAVLQRAAVGVPFGWLAWRSHDHDRAVLYGAALLSPLILAKTNDVFPQSDHFLQMWPVFAVPLVMMGAAEAYRMLKPEHRVIARWGLAVVAAVGLAYPLAYQVRAMQDLSDGFVITAAERDVYRWINANVDDDAVIVSPSRSTNYLLASYTHAYTYLADGIFTRVSDDELADRYLRAQVTFGYSEADTFERLDPAYGAFSDRPREAGVSAQEHTELSMVDFLFGEQFVVPARFNEKLPEWRERFRALRNETNAISAYDADYLLCDHRARFWRADQPAPGTHVRPVYSRDDIVLYEIVDQAAAGAVAFAGCDPAAEEVAS